MRLCIISHQNELTPQMLEFARRMTIRGIEVHAILPSLSVPRREVHCDDGVHRHIARVVPLPRLYYPSYILSALIAGLPLSRSAYLAHEVYTGLIAALVKLLTGRKTAIYVVDAQTDLKIGRGMWTSKLLIRIGRAVEFLSVRNADLLIALDSSLKPYLQMLGAGKIVVVSYGANLEMFAAGNAKRIREKRELSGMKVVTYAGGMEPHHGAQYLARAAPIIAENRPDTKVMFVGDGPLRPELEKTAGRAAIFVGQVSYSDVPDYLAASDVLVIPAAPQSRYVSVITTKVFDYLSSGRAIVATDVGGIREAVGEACLIVPPEDPVSLAEAVIVLLNDENLRAELGARARRLAEERFDWNVLTDELVSALKGLAWSK